MISAWRGSISRLRGRFPSWPLTWQETSTVGLTLVLVGFCIFRGRTEEERPTSEASLQSGLPSAGERFLVRGIADKRAHRLRVQARTLKIDSFAPRRGQQPIPSVSLLIPVSASTCRALESSTAGICRSGHPLSVTGMSVDWGRAASFQVGFSEPASLSWQAGASANGPQRLPVWTLEPGADEARVRVRCLKQNRFDLVIPSGPISGSCTSGGRRIWLRVEAPAGGAPRLVFDGTKSFFLRIGGSREMKAPVDDGLLSVAGETREIRHSREVVDLRTSSSDLGVTMAGSARPSGDELTVTAPEVKAATVDSEEELPSHFDGLESEWWALFGIFLAFWLAAVGATLRAWFGGEKADA